MGDVRVDIGTVPEFSHTQLEWLRKVIAQEPNTPVVPHSPATFEQALSHISAGIGALETVQPTTTEGIERVRAQLMRLDRVFAKQEGAMKWLK